MLSRTVSQRARGLKRAPAPMRQLAALDAGRARIRAALERCAERERAVLALRLFERLTPAEAAQALGMPITDLLSTYDALIRELRRSLRGLRFRSPFTQTVRMRIAPDARVREN